MDGSSIQGWSSNSPLGSQVCLLGPLHSCTCAPPFIHSRTQKCILPAMILPYCPLYFTCGGVVPEYLRLCPVNCLVSCAARRTRLHV
jgi:hypothetical protein